MIISSIVVVSFAILVISCIIKIPFIAVYLYQCLKGKTPRFKPSKTYIFLDTLSDVAFFTFIISFVTLFIVGT